jgi:hypothetical protein
MGATMKKLPIGIQSFEIMRSDAYYYVDKTPLIKKLVDQGRYFFLSRPRRFGKSLFIDTLKHAFSGKKEYFSGLYLEDHWDWDVCYPVISLSFGTGVVNNSDHLETIIVSLMDEVARRYGIKIEGELSSLRFRELIIKLHDQHRKKVVILIDEYDKPILDNIENSDIARNMRECLKNFYSVIKDCDPYLKFVFLTGISKFSKVSLFSVLNNLQDITLDSRYAAICGYTHDELISVFANQLENVDIGKIKHWYNGYNFLGENVYNPFDILLFLDNREFRNYWFETGTPTFLIKLIQEKQYPVPKIERAIATDQLLGSFDIHHIEVETLLFQTGYLTIGSIRTVLDSNVYTLVYPNFEVKRSLTDFILGYLTRNMPAKEENKLSLLDILLTPDMDRLRDLFHSFFASIPHDWYRKNEIARYEGYYASVFYCYFTALGLDVTAEDATNHGRIDLTVKLERRIFILEFKVVNLDTGKTSALEQIKTKGYHEKYRADADEIFLIGVEFDCKERNIIRFEYETICTGSDKCGTGSEGVTISEKKHRCSI